MTFVPQFDPTLTLAQLLGSNGLEQGEAFTWLANQLANTSPPFPVAGWQSNGLYVQQLQAIAAELSLTNDVISSLAGTCSVALAPGNANPRSGIGSTNVTWLDLAAWSRYRLQRALATSGVFAIQFSVASGFGPYTITPSGAWISDPSGTYTYQSINTTPATLTSAEPVVIQFRASVSGTGPNVLGPGAPTSVSMVTPLLGVTATTFDLGSGNCTVIPGSDPQSDVSLITACQTQWATISPVATQSTIIHWAIVTSAASALGTVTDLMFVEGTALSPGLFDVYIATSAGVAPGAVVTAVQSGYGGLPGVSQVQPELITGTVISCGTYTVNVFATIYVPAAQLTQCQAEVLQAFAVLQSEQEISDGATRGTLYYSDIVAVCQNLDSQTGSAARNVESCTANGTTADVTPATIGFSNIALLALTHAIAGPPVSNLTFVGV